MSKNTSSFSAFVCIHKTTSHRPIDLDNLLRFRVTRVLAHIMRTVHAIFNTIDFMRSLHRKGSYLWGCEVWPARDTIQSPLGRRFGIAGRCNEVVQTPKSRFLFCMQFRKKKGKILISLQIQISAHMLILKHSRYVVEAREKVYWEICIGAVRKQQCMRVKRVKMENGVNRVNWSLQHYCNYGT